MPVKLFLAARRPGWPLIHIVEYFEGRTGDTDVIFTSKLPEGFSYDGFELADTVETADYVLVPHGLKKIGAEEREYLNEVKKFALQSDKEAILFIGGDLSHRVFADDFIVFKGSQYRYLRRKNEIIVPPFCEDLSEIRPLTVRQKKEKPTVSFCGFSGFSSIPSRAKYLLKNALLGLWALFTPHVVVHKRGIYFRRKAMRVLEKDGRIEARFITRKTFSGNRTTISLDPAQARREYVENMHDSDFVLSPKGDGNFSVRFYEALSMGRIPVLIDTETCLPLEGIVAYDKFIIRVPYAGIHRIGSIIIERYNNMSNEEFAAMQRAARAAFEKYLRYDAFFNVIFRSLKERGVQALR